ncbi:F-box domain-containing protein [Mycena indigotica]|uniref:F-box domain-containing protein n=1 Tax=Mycena indigotica TaxID=2126181 RepID=A0A8H6W8L6_9AGAR|nr:F-box domain-containing protein [Mycena indigotica]KAF7307051.1 F-box domain-containing protein [Mycena indigotica]
MPPRSIIELLPEEDLHYLSRVAALRHQPGHQGALGDLRIPDQTMINQYFKGLVNSWEPHEFTAQERENIRQEGLRYVVITRELERAQRDLYPRRLPPDVESQLAFAKQSYLVRYFRLFRVNALPSEVLNNILRYVVWDTPRRPVLARLTITWVCRRWRENLLHDSTIWTAIWFRPGPLRVERAFTWFDRARQAPMDIRIDTEDEANSSLLLTEADIRGIISRIVLTKPRSVRMLILTLDDWPTAITIMDLLAKYGPSGLPALERFELHRGGLKNEDRNSLTWPPLDPKPFLGGAHAPQLTYLSLNGVPVQWKGSILENLTTFDIRRLPSSHMPDLPRFREILNSCPRLIKLSLDGAGPRFDNLIEAHPMPVDLPLLRTLVLADFTRPYATFILSLFTARNVIDLTLMNFCGEDYSSVFTLMTGMFPHVRLLTAYSLEFHPYFRPAMVRWMDSMPRLAYLRTANQSSHFYGLFFREKDPMINPVAPLLKFIDCQMIEPLPLLARWVQDRARLGLPIKKIYISEQLGERLNEALVRELMAAGSGLSRLPKGATTPEEETLKNEP